MGQLPKHLTGGEGHSVFMDLAELRDVMREAGLTGNVKLRPVFHDALGRSHYGKRFKVSAGST